MWQVFNRPTEILEFQSECIENLDVLSTQFNKNLGTMQNTLTEEIANI